VSEPWKAFAEEAEPGGADRFLDFIVSELKPLIQSRYSGDPDDSAVIGGSAGGTFGLYALLNRPGVFSRYVIGSPPFAWDDRLVFRYEEDYARTHDDLPARVFMAAGSLETEAEFHRSLQGFPEEARRAWEAHGHTEIVEGLGPMTEALRGRNYPGLELTSHIFEGENHASVVGALFSRGLRVVYGN
jgi:predicted alpha/beta superfamily hydrolase